MTVDFKDLLIFISLATALVSVAFNIYNSRKTIYINAVTTSRIKYMDNLRSHISEFRGLTLHLVLTELDKKEQNVLIEKVDRLRFIIKLHLNRKKPFDKELIDKINSIPKLTDPHKINVLENELNELVNLTQDVLSLEWDGIKEEADKGKLRNIQRQKLTEKHLANYGKVEI